MTEVGGVVMDVKQDVRDLELLRICGYPCIRST